jgi:hypothetical protein
MTSAVLSGDEGREWKGYDVAGWGGLRVLPERIEIATRNPVRRCNIELALMGANHQPVVQPVILFGSADLNDLA